MICLNSKYREKTYRFIPFLGCLISRNKYNASPNSKDINYCRKVIESLRVVENPFEIKKSDYRNINPIEVTWRIKLYAKTLVWLHKHFYWGLLWISKLRISVFANSEDAISVFCKIIPHNQNNLCLPRSIFAATTSKRFRKEGVIFLGVMHPSRHMHAWIIEDGFNPYKYDMIWTNFSPVALIP